MRDSRAEEWGLQRRVVALNQVFSRNERRAGSRKEQDDRDREVVCQERGMKGNMKEKGEKKKSKRFP